MSRNGWTAVTVIVLALAVPASALAGNKAKTVVDLNGYQVGPGSSFKRLFGSLSSPKGQCKLGRKVIIKEALPAGGYIQRGFTFSDSYGNFSLQTPDFTLQTGVFKATAKRHVVRGTTCKKGTDTLVLP